MSIKNQLILSGLVLFVGILPALLSFFPFLIPHGEDQATWFQRSGSIMVVFSAISEFRLLALLTTINPGEQTLVQSSESERRYKKPHTILSAIALFLAILGTVIWGYGDLLVQNA